MESNAESNAESSGVLRKASRASAALASSAASAAASAASAAASAASAATASAAESNADPASIAVQLDGFPPLPKDTKGRARRPLPPGLEKWGMKVDAETGGKQLSTARLGMTSSALCASTDTVSQELIFACVSVLSKAGLLFVFSVSQSFDLLVSDSANQLLGVSGNVALVAWNMLYPLFIAMAFVMVATEHVKLL